MSCGWSDVGAWEALWHVANKDDSGNGVSGDVMLEGTRNSLVFSKHRLVTCVGLDNIVVVETADAVLVVDKSRTQEIRKVVNRLKTERRAEADTHRKVHRPWGSYDAIDQGERFQVKRIIVNPGAKLSLQMHHHRAEHWIVVRGTARVTRNDESFLLAENESTYIPLGETHSLENPGKLPLEVIEVQSGAYLGEDDIVRFEDVYGRR
jgi:mannose-1-phosphate guanylyltransferase/mannose-6-phosphate isomerase